MYFHRNIEQAIEDLSRQFPVILVTGPRQVGKTTVLQRIAKTERTYVTLDTWENRQLANSDPKLFLEHYPPPVIIDEIQYAPALFAQIKVQVDRNKKNGMFWLSGSQQFSLMQNLSESLAGRVAILKLLGFSSSEIAKKEYHRGEPWSPTVELSSKLAPQTFKEISQRIFRGGFPKLYSDKSLVREDVYFSSYIQTYLERDVRDVAQVGDLRDFERFIRACAARTAQLLNITEIARDIGIAPNTAKRWLSVLQASFQIYLLEPYYKNITTRMIKSPKLYFLDTGLLAYLTGWKSPETLMAGAMSGAVFETFIVSEILKSWWGRGMEPPIWFWRTKEKEEIDIIFDIDGVLYPLEIKLTATPKMDHISSVKKFLSLTGAKKGYLICFSEKRFPLTEQIELIPYFEIL